MEFHVVIPARFASTRLPGKPLRLIAGKPMIHHVYERALEASASSVTIATDDDRIARTCTDFGASVCMTTPDHQSGTDRLAEVATRFGFSDEAIIVNLQGDEPLMPPACISQVAQVLAQQHDAQAATLAYPLTAAKDVFDPNRVKLVMEKGGRVMYFSRAPIPWDRNAFANPMDGAESGSSDGHLGHIGLYAYRAGYLREYTNLPPSPLEQLESLEQLRVLWHGGKIYAAVACEPVHHGVDKEEDLRAVEQALMHRQAGA